MIYNQLIKLKSSSKFYYAITALILLLVEIYIALYINDSFIRPYLGDVIAIGWVYCCLKSVTNYSVMNTAIAALIIGYLIEFAQFLKIVELVGLQDVTWARIVIGTHFSWLDLVCYTVGFILIIVTEWIKTNINSKAQLG